MTAAPEELMKPELVWPEGVTWQFRITSSCSVFLNIEHDRNKTLVSPQFLWMACRKTHIYAWCLSDWQLLLLSFRDTNTRLRTRHCSTEWRACPGWAGCWRRASTRTNWSQNGRHLRRYHIALFCICFDFHSYMPADGFSNYSDHFESQRQY